MEEATYGGISRSDAKISEFSYKAGGGCLTMEMLQCAFEAIERIDENYRRQEQKFFERMRPYSHLAMNDWEAYFAAYRLMRSSVWAENALHPEEARRLIEILKSRGIEL